MVRSESGFVVLRDGLVPIYANKESIQILCYPEIPRGLSRLNNYVGERIRSLMRDARSKDFQASYKVLLSGKRHYHCRLFPLGASLKGGESGSAMALLIERSLPASFDFVKVAAMYRLTQRESETTQFLLQGLTSKEIAQRMNLSPNTIKTFLRMIMVKMNVTSRTGIVLKCLGIQPAEQDFTPDEL